MNPPAAKREAQTNPPAAKREAQINSPTPEERARIAGALSCTALALSLAAWAVLLIILAAVVFK